MPENKHGIGLWPCSERPREKLLRSGEHLLTDAELLAILLGSGLGGKSALDLAREVMQKFGSFSGLCRAEKEELLRVKGLGQAKVCRLKAAVEICRRISEEPIIQGRVILSSPEAVAGMLLPRMGSLKKEVFKLLLLDSRNRIIENVEIEQGTVNRAYPLVREIFHAAIRGFAAAIICVHNHPSGDPEPSREDIAFTVELVAAGKALQVPVLDHIIIGEKTFVSLNERRML